MERIKINNFKEEVLYEKLDNGLDVYLLPLENKKNFFATLTVKYGGRNTIFKKDGEVIKLPSGIAHFLEHKLFDKKNMDILPFEFYTSTATSVNAATYSDKTMYYFFGNNNFYGNLEYLLNWLKDFEISEEDVEKERNIILEEARGKESVVEYILSAKALENTFLSDTSKDRIIGDENSIKNITKEDILMSYNSFYRPDNMILVASGNFSALKTLDLIKDTLKDYKAKNEVIEKIYNEEIDEVVKDFELLELNVTIPRFKIIYKMNKNLFEGVKNYKLQYYLMLILNAKFSQTSKFYEEAKKVHLFDSFNFEVLESSYHYLFSFTGISNNYEELIERIHNELTNINIPLEDFERIKKIWIASEIRIFDNIKALALNIVDSVIDYNEYKNNPIKDIKDLDYNTLQNINNNLNIENRAIVIIK